MGGVVTAGYALAGVFGFTANGINTMRGKNPYYAENKMGEKRQLDTLDQKLREAQNETNQVYLKSHKDRDEIIKQYKEKYAKDGKYESPHAEPTIGDKGEVTLVFKPNEASQFYKAFSEKVKESGKETVEFSAYDSITSELTHFNSKKSGYHNTSEVGFAATAEKAKGINWNASANPVLSVSGTSERGMNDSPQAASTPAAPAGAAEAVGDRCPAPSDSASRQPQQQSQQGLIQAVTNNPQLSSQTTRRGPASDLNDSHEGRNVRRSGLGSNEG